MSRSLTPQNPLTTNTISVSSSAGFSAGDLVYQKSGSINPIPDGAATTGNFDITATVNTSPAGSTANIVQVSGYGSSGGGGAIYGTPQAAKLTNGNIVVVYQKGASPYPPYFRIIDENNTEVVAETALPTYQNGLSPAAISVCALTGGGFAVGWANTSNYLVYAIYTNTGTVTLTSTQDTTVSPYAISLANRPDGSFVILIADTAVSSTRFKVYSSTGTQVVAWTTLGSYYVANGRNAVAVRSDNSFVFAVQTATNTLTYYIYTAAGASSSSATITASAEATGQHVDLSALTNDDVVMFYTTNTPSVARRILTAANSLGGETVIANSTYLASGVKALTGGGYILVWGNGTAGNLSYAIYNSSNTSLYGTQQIYGMGNYSSNKYNYSTILQLANNIAILGTYTPASSLPWFTAMAQVVTATGALRSFSTQSLIVGSVSAAVNNYVKGSSTPNAAYFAAASSGTLTQTVSKTPSFVLSAVTVESTSVTNAYCRVMQNGQIVIAYCGTGGSYTVKFAVYTPAGVYVNTYTVANSNVSTTWVKACVLGNGKLVIAWTNSNNEIKFAIYSTSYSLLVSGNLTTLLGYAPTNVTSNNYGFDIAALSVGNRFALVYCYSSYAYVTVISDTGTAVSTNNMPNSSQYNVAICSLSNGGYAVRTQDSSPGSGTYVVTYAYAGGSSYINISNTGTNGDSYYTGLGQVITATPQGMIMFYAINNSSAQSIYWYDASSGGYTNIVSITASSAVLGNCAIGVLNNGSFIVIRQDVNSSQYYNYVYSPSYTTAAQSTDAITYSSIASSTPNPSVCALFDNEYVVSYKNASSYPTFYIASAIAGSYSTTTVAGTTLPNAAGLLPSQSNGYILKGVAVTPATAGGTGLVQNVGQAQLNSNYPSGTTYQAFDSTGTVVQGTKGTIVGRNVNMTGNS